MKFPPSARWGIAQWQHRIRLKTERAAVRLRGQDPFLGLSRGRPHGRAAVRADAGAQRGGVRSSSLPRAFVNGPARKSARALPWFAVAYGAGIVLYFTAEREPALWAAASLTALCALAAVLLRRQIVPYVVALGAFGIALGFAVATIKTSLIDHPVLRFSTSGVTVAGFVELREESQHTDRFVLRVERMEGGRMDDKPLRVRLSVKRGTAPPAGSFVEVKASLEPPLQPLEPGSYDFARDLFFQGIGASGFVRGAVKVIAAPAPQGPRQRADAFVQRMRDAIDARIRAVLPGDEGAIAAMLINGKRDAIAPNVYDALFASATFCRFPAITWQSLPASYFSSSAPATTPYAAFHFHRVAPYGVLANLLAMPVVSAWVMPMGILGIVAMPFGLDAEFWRQMGYGIEWMNAVGLWVASLPGAFGRVTLFGNGALLLMTAGLLVIGLLKTPLRWIGFLPAALAIFWAASKPLPDVLIAADGRSFAVRGADGRLALHHIGGDSFAVREWLAADADGRDVHDRGLGQGIACDPSGCIGKLADGALVAYVLAPDAYEEDCRRAALVVATRGDPPADCRAKVIPRGLWRQRGALALRRQQGADGVDFVIDATRPKNFDRPWSPAAAPAPAPVSAPTAPGTVSSATVSQSATNSVSPRAPARDATPRQDDIEADQ